MAKKQRARVGKDKAADTTVQNVAEPFYVGVQVGAGVCEGFHFWILRIESRSLADAVVKGLRQEFSSHEQQPSFETVPGADHDVTERAQIELDIDERQPLYLAALERQRMEHHQRNDRPDPVGAFLGWVVERAEKLAGKIRPMLKSVVLEPAKSDKTDLAVAAWKRASVNAEDRRLTKTRFLDDWNRDQSEEGKVTKKELDRRLSRDRARTNRANN